MFFLFKQKKAYEMRISDWSSDVCSSDLAAHIAQSDKGDVHNVSPSPLPFRGEDMKAWREAPSRSWRGGGRSNHHPPLPTLSPEGERAYKVTAPSTRLRAFR